LGSLGGVKVGGFQGVEKTDCMPDNKICRRVFGCPAQNILVPELFMNIFGAHARQILSKNSAEVLPGDLSQAVQEGPFEKGRAKGGNQRV